MLKFLSDGPGLFSFNIRMVIKKKLICANAGRNISPKNTSEKYPERFPSYQFWMYSRHKQQTPNFQLISWNIFSSQRENKASIYNCQDRQIARDNHSFTEAYSTTRLRKFLNKQTKPGKKKTRGKMSQSRIIFGVFPRCQKYQSLTDFFLTPLYALNYFFWKEELYETTNWGTGFVSSGDLRAPQPSKLLCKEEISAELVALDWFVLSQPWWFPVNSVWLLTNYPHTHTAPHFQDL